MRHSIIEQAIQELQNRAGNGMIDPVQFRKHYWQKRPLLIRGAFPQFQDPITADELAGLACDDQVESRLVMERGGAKPWQVIPGPQRSKTLRQLPSSHWTLLVQGVDRWVPAVADLLDSFRFVPDWRVDDVMISFAPRGGTVGPHIDSYDVFLLQGKGRRRWQIDSTASTELCPGLDLRILKAFRAKQEWVLESGDMLYLPPNLAHYGVALEDCLTYSIGFRSPSVAELLSAVYERLLQTGSVKKHFTDAGLKKVLHPGEISRSAVGDLRHLLDQTMQSLTPDQFDDVVGQLLTQSKSSLGMEESENRENAGRARLKQGDSLVRGSRQPDGVYPAAEDDDAVR